MGSKGSGLSRILTLRRHHDSDTDSFGSEEAAAANPKKKNRPRIQFGLFTEDSEREKRKLLDSLSEVCYKTVLCLFDTQIVGIMSVFKIAYIG